MPALSLLAGKLGGAGTADGTGSAARFAYATDLVGDGAGNLFVTDNGTIRTVVIATGVVTTLAGTTGFLGARDSADGTGTAARFASTTGLASDGAGNLFVTDNNTIRKVVIATGVVTTLAGTREFGSADGTGAAARFGFPQGVVSDGAGNLFVADGNNSTIRKVVIATGAVTTIAGTPGASGSADGTAAAARFDYPAGVAIDGAGNLYVTDSRSSTIRKVVIATGVVTTIAGTPGAPGSADGTAAAARFNYPGSVTADGGGNLFVADSVLGVGGGTIRKVVMATGVVTTLAETPGSTGSAGGTGTLVRFSTPRGLASDGAGSLFVIDGSTILKVVIPTGVTSPLAGNTGFSGDVDGTGAAARFGFSPGMVSDAAGNLFITDNGTIRKVVIATGEVTTLAGSPGTFGSVDGTGAAARFYGPRGLASDRAGNLFVVDRGSSTIRKVVIATGEVTTLAGSPLQNGNANGTGPTARFAFPVDVATDGAGNLFVADSGNAAIRKVVIATGVVTRLALKFADGTGTAAGFTVLSGVTSDGAGNLFVADSDIDGAFGSGNNVIRKVVIATGVVTTIAGSPGAFGSADGTGTTASFRTMMRVASDGAGNLFVADFGNSTIRKVEIATGVVTTFVGSAGHPVVTLGLLPAGLNRPIAVAVGPDGSLFISDENSILQVR